MDVQLYVYDLSRGMARQYSMALAGIQIDAIYHTAIVLGGVEYFFGQGIHRKIPGSTHHGQPMKIIDLGKTQLPSEVIQEYVQSLEAIYTPESYDLFMHNCNNFSQDLAMFLVGKSIPEEIRTLPETFLRTPIGQMLRGQIDQSMRQMTQAPDAMSGRDVQRATATTTSTTPTPTIPAPATTSKATVKSSSTTTPAHGPAEFFNGRQPAATAGHVYNITSTSELDKLLRKANSNCACIFFTSATCPPCKLVYPAYDELAAEAGDRATLIKVDVSVAFDIARRYSIRATPTFITFLKGKKDQEWSGAQEAQLRGNIRLLIHMANPQHAHTRLKLPSFHDRILKPILYSRLPPLEKLMAKIGPSTNDKSVQEFVRYLNTRGSEGLQNAALPDLTAFFTWVFNAMNELPDTVHFAIIDLVRVAAADPRVSSYLVTEQGYKTILKIIPKNDDHSKIPYNIQATTLQLVNNLFSSTIFQEALLDTTHIFRGMIESLASASLLATHQNARALAGALVYNLSAINHNERLSNSLDKIDSSSLIDVEVALLEATTNENENKDTLHALLLALGSLLYGADPQNSSIHELCVAMDVRSVLQEKSKMAVFKEEQSLLKEVGEELLGKGV